MKRLFAIVFVSLLVFVACNKETSTGTELVSMNFLSLGIDGNTDLLVNNLKSAVVANDEITEAEILGLKWMREEEKLAADLYTAFYTKFEMRIFNNISRSEHTHMDAILMLIDTFQVEDPLLAEFGKFTNPDLQKAFDELNAAGEVSLVEALKVGAYVEEMDILDLEKQLEIVENVDIRLVYENLLRGSRNHLRAFTKVLGWNDVNYQPTLLTDEYFAEVINSDMERGNKENCGLGYGYANRNKGQQRAGYNAANAECDGEATPANNGNGRQNRRGRNGN